MYEWDEAKNARNIAKHGISFDFARRIFDGFILTMPDDRRDYGEARYISIGMVDGIAVLVVVHTSRAGKVRIISARPASTQERKNYEKALP